VITYMDKTHERQLAAAFAWRKIGADMRNDTVRKLIDLGAGPMAGGAIGEVAAATFQAAQNADSFFVISPDLFDQATIKNVWSSKIQAIPGFGASDGFDVAKRGLLGKMLLTFTGSLVNTHNTGTVAATDLWPYGLLSEIKFSINGSPLLRAHGDAYRVRRLMTTEGNSDGVTSSVSSAGTNPVTIVWEIPVAEDMHNLWGAVLTQADDLSVRLDYTQEALANLFTITGNDTVTLTGNLQITYVSYDVPVVPVQGQEKGILPDVSVLHRFSEFSQPVTGNGDTEVKLQQTAGEVERLIVWLDNTLGAKMDPASWSQLRFQFAETEEPMTFNPISSLLIENSYAYNGKLPKVAAVDLSNKNQARDGLFPKGVANPKVIVTLPSTVTPNANARLYVVQESLVSGA
jgi:hypothetical protein